MTPTITPLALNKLLDGGQPIDVIDVRTPIEYRAAHVTGVRLMPLDALDPAKVQQSRPSGVTGPCYVLCKTGARAAKAAEQLAAAGVEVCVIEGGTDACIAAGLPITRGKQGVSLERQVRIVAGLLVAVGCGLAVAVHPWFLALPAFIGLGLVFAGITDTCAMGLALAKMPWNR